MASTMSDKWEIVVNVVVEYIAKETIDRLAKDWSAEVVLPSGHHLGELKIHVEERLSRPKKTDVKNVW
ncbi:hypothetical protein KCU89_g75, partial [Aureobasidium melanogenum]